MKNTAKKAAIKVIDTFRMPLFRAKLLFKRSEINRLKAKIANHSLASLSQKPLDTLDKRVFLSLSMRINSNIRQEIFEQTMKLSLGKLDGAPVTIRVSDASPEVFHQNNKKIIEDVIRSKPNIKLEYNLVPLRQPPANHKVLTEAPEENFLMVYDDQALINVTPSLIAAGCDVLEFFEGEVDVVLLEGANAPKTDDQNKKIIIDMNTLEFRDRNVKPVGVIEFRGHKFAIVPNFHYGFFFNTIVANAKEYAKRLKWYMDNVSELDSNKIELAGLKRLGPSFKYLAIPLDAMMVNLDFSHTEHSSRGHTDTEKNIYDHLLKGYSIETIN